MANIVFRLSRRQFNGVAEVIVRFYHSRSDHSCPTGIYVPVSAWKDGRCVISKRYETPANTQARKAQADLDALAAHIYNAYTRTHVCTHAWLQETVRSFHHPATDATPLADLIDDYCNARHVAPATIRKMHALRTHLQNHKPTLTTACTTEELQHFAAYLANDGKARNSVSCRLRQLRTLLYWYGKPNPNPFDGLEIPADTYGTPIYLTVEERDRLLQCNTLTPAKAVQRDIFVFQCFTGCRVADLYTLTAANIQDGWLAYIPQKTNRHKPTTVEVPLAPAALAIVEKYKGVDKHGRLLPFISTQRYNEYIKAICKDAGLNRPVMILDQHTFKTTPRMLWEVVTSHTARKTFTQAVYSATGDKRLTASMTGHSENSQAFNRYSEISRQMKLQVIRNLSENTPQ